MHDHVFNHCEVRPFTSKVRRSAAELLGHRIVRLDGMPGIGHSFRFRTRFA